MPANYVQNSKSQNEEGIELSPLHDACRRGNLELLEECLLNRYQEVLLAGTFGFDDNNTGMWEERKKKHEDFETRKLLQDVFLYLKLCFFHIFAK